MHTTNVEMTETSPPIRLLTLNCWGFAVISKHKDLRLSKIAEYLATGELDIVALQEIWCKSDYLHLKQCLATVFPYSHYFYSGVIGSGLCIFSCWPIEEIAFSEYLLSGPSIARKIFKGDKLGGRGIAMTVIRHPQHGPIHVFTTHLMATYGSKVPDENQSHRVCQAFQLVQFVKSHRPRFTILCGDFNSTPLTEPYNIITSYGQMKDAWLEIAGNESTKGITINRPENVYRKKHEDPMRIDFVFYATNPGERSVLKCQSSEVTMGKIPGTNIYFSDHNGIYSEFEVCEQVDSADPSIDNKASVDSVIVAEQLTAFALTTASARCHQQIIVSLFFFFLWLSLTVIALFPSLLTIFLIDSVDTVAFSTPFFGLLLSISLTVAICFGLLSLIVSKIEINRLTQLQQEMKFVCHALEQSDIQ